MGRKKHIKVADLVHPSRQPIEHNFKVGDTVTFTKEVCVGGSYGIGDEVKIVSIKADKHMQGGFMVTVEKNDKDAKNPSYPIIFFTDHPLWFGGTDVREHKRKESE